MTQTPSSQLIAFLERLRCPCGFKPGPDDDVFELHEDGSITLHCPACLARQQQTKPELLQ